MTFGPLAVPKVIEMQTKRKRRRRKCEVKRIRRNEKSTLLTEILNKLVGKNFHDAKGSGRCGGMIASEPVRFS